MIQSRKRLTIVMRDVSVDEKWKQIIQTDLETMAKNIQEVKEQRKYWMTSEVFNLMEERKNSKGNKDE